jgi:hypothetical protein
VSELEKPATPTPPPGPGIRPIETAIIIGAFLLLCANCWADWQNNQYGGGVVSVALIGLIGALFGKNAGSLFGGGK